MPERVPIPSGVFSPSLYQRSPVNLLHTSIAAKKPTKYGGREMSPPAWSYNASRIWMYVGSKVPSCLRPNFFFQNHELKSLIQGRNSVNTLPVTQPWVTLRLHRILHSEVCRPPSRHGMFQRPRIRTIQHPLKVDLITGDAGHLFVTLGIVDITAITNEKDLIDFLRTVTRFAATFNSNIWSIW